MIFSLRLFIIACLVVLQFIAPLVHAHTSEKILSQGLHIPGLEVYDRLTPQEAVDSMQAVNVSSCKAVLFCGDIDGQVVGVDAGFSRNFATPMQKLYKIIADLPSHYLPAHAVVFATEFSAFFVTLPNHVTPLFGRLAYFSNSPRAPPAHA